MNPFQSLAEYEEFIYTLNQRYLSIRRSTLVLARRGQGLATLAGDLHFSQGYRLVVYEILTWDSGSVFIQHYSYEVWKGGDKLYWYDPQPHPDDPSLASTHPHHKHVLPATTALEASRSGIKHNRVPTPGIRFDEPNLSLLVQEIEQQL